jgi:hypothetical protein
VIQNTHRRRRAKEEVEVRRTQSREKLNAQ